jgi:hypothetical protein
MGRAWMVAGVVCALALSSGCGKGSLESEITSKLRQCGFLTDGDFSLGPIYPHEECFFRCAMNSSCGEIQDFLCSWDDTNLEARCNFECRFTCDGGARQIPWYYVCDRDLDCADGSDERNCRNYFQCNNGYVIPGHWVCDGDFDCGSGEDEANCRYFQCYNGRNISLHDQCDGYADCPGGEDEIGCATLNAMCPVTLCTNTCWFAFDGDCDDGGPGSDFSLCELGTDCFDCGPR